MFSQKVLCNYGGYTGKPAGGSKQLRSRIVRIGNSQGLRIPKTLLEEAGIHDTVDVSVEDGSLIVRPAHRAREGWAEAAQAMRDRGEDRLLEPETPTAFDEEEWVW